MIPHLTTHSTHAEIEVYVAWAEQEIGRRWRQRMLLDLADQHPAEVEAARQAREAWEEARGKR